MSEDAQTPNKSQHVLAIVLTLAATVASGAIFLVSLLRQLALVEIAASLVTSLQVFFLSSAIADMIEKKREISRRRTFWVVVFAVLLIAFYFLSRYSQ